ncbi:hypothetical protein CJU80_17635 [Pseudomonas fragi]|nr:hypothetical protein CJF37_19730 [Pseudomonas fragi]HBP46664.1 hypothetical protein [Pseudomonas sp.]PAA00254.1 hypothetical protein CJU76_22135 [Pseudomonas fragi]PAA28762.1 hypothetical protein CJU72_05110 [Pseudomonas fragi]PAA34091.1 hypothetical protein CJU79_21565 [Pseudomonas fragi]
MMLTSLIVHLDRWGMEKARTGSQTSSKPGDATGHWAANFALELKTKQISKCKKITRKDEQPS